MTDGVLLGALLLGLGIVIGSGVTLAITWRYERERTILHQIIGRYQQAMDEAQPIPEEEL
jgi:hypothetical protein